MLSIVFILFSCSFDDYYYFKVQNDSSRTITYTFNGDPQQLTAGDFKNYEIKNEGQYRTVENSNAGNPYGFNIGVGLKRIGQTFTYYDIEPHDLNVVNILPFDVTLKSEYLDNAGSTELTIQYNETKTAKIYARTSNFTLTPSAYPIVIDRNFNNNTNTVYLIIK